MSHEIKNAQYNVRGEMITIVEHDGKPWVTWASLKDLAKFPPATSIPVIESTIEGGLGEEIKKTKVPKSDGNLCQGWLLSMSAVSTILTARFDGKDHLMIEQIQHCFDLFKDEKGLPDSGGSDTQKPDSPTSLQENDQGKGAGSPGKGVREKKVVRETIEGLADKFSKAMDTMGNSVSQALNNVNNRMIKLESDLNDQRVTISSLAEAAKSDAETISKLLVMLEKAKD